VLGPPKLIKSTGAIEASRDIYCCPRALWPFGVVLGASRPGGASGLTRSLGPSVVL
jgi:hypothetical protein